MRAVRWLGRELGEEKRRGLEGEPWLCSLHPVPGPTVYWESTGSPLGVYPSSSSTLGHMP